jgi:hypothetical protein
VAETTRHFTLTSLVVMEQPTNDLSGLQGEFTALVAKMVEAKIPLPNSFKLYYRVMFHSDRQGQVVSIRPFLDEDDAHADCGQDRPWEGKYGSKITFEVLDDANHVITENFRSDHEHVLHRLDVLVPNTW